ncbi:MAG: hypothetical protein ACI9SY_000369 [Candidatus Paceibacteria bacterium]|jgi:hypothetical protein
MIYVLWQETYELLATFWGLVFTIQDGGVVLGLGFFGITFFIGHLSALPMRTLSKANRAVHVIYVTIAIAICVLVASGNPAVSFFQALSHYIDSVALPLGWMFPVVIHGAIFLIPVIITYVSACCLVKPEYSLAATLLAALAVGDLYLTSTAFDPLFRNLLYYEAVALALVGTFIVMQLLWQDLFTQKTEFC